MVEVVLITIGGLIFSNILGETSGHKSKPLTDSCDYICANLTDDVLNATNGTQLEYLPFGDSVFFVITTITTIGKAKQFKFYISITFFHPSKGDTPINCIFYE